MVRNLIAELSLVHTQGYLDELKELIENQPNQQMIINFELNLEDIIDYINGDRKDLKTFGS